MNATTRTAPRTASRTSRMSADERREAIVAAAVEEFATGGLVGASTDAIARRAGVSQPYIFQLFGTKKDLFLAVVRLCFGRTRQTFERAVREWEPGQIPECDTPLGAIGLAYKRLLADRNQLLVQLQAYAACSDPEVRRVVRDEFGGLHRRVRELSGASADELQEFFATGMLLNIAAAVELPGSPSSWMLDDLEGGV